MASEYLKASQREAFGTLQQQSNAQSVAIAALQKQLTQVQTGMFPQGTDADAALKSAAPVVVGEQHLVFSLGDHEFAVKAELVQGVERLTDLTPVPNVAAWVKGVMNLRGAITSVVDLRMFLGLEQLSYSPRTRLLSLQYNEMVISLIVDGVSEMLPVPPMAMISGTTRQAAIPQWVAPYAAGSALLANRVLVLLDVERLLFSNKMQHYEVQ